MNSVFQNRLGNISSSTSEFNRAGAAKFQSTRSIDALPEALQNAIRSQALKEVMLAFISIVPIVAVATVMAAFLGNVWIPAEATSNNTAVENTGCIDVDGGCEKYGVASNGPIEQRLQQLRWGS